MLLVCYLALSLLRWGEGYGVVCCRYCITTYIDWSPLGMKGKDLFSNIQEARQHINRLKKEAELLQGTPQEVLATNINEYMNEVIYTLNKNELEIDKKHREYKDKLPIIATRKEEIPSFSSLKRQRKKIHSTIKPSKEDSTKIEDSFSFQIENRPMKMYSHHEKNVRAVDYTADRININNTQAEISLESGVRRSTPGSSNFRTRHDQKKPIRPVEFNPSREGLRNRSYLKPTVAKVVSHEFDVVNGVVNQGSPEFSSYQRVYESIFPKIQEQLGRVQAILERQLVEYAKLDGKKLAYLCLKDKISESELLSCLGDIPLRSKLQEPQSRFGGKEGKAKAADVIAAYWKMRNVRDKYQTLRKSTVIIQRFFRKKLLKLDFENKVEDKNRKIVDNFERRQSKFAKEYKTIKEEKRIEIHLASVEVDEEKRLTMDYFPERQNVQLSRIFRLKDPNLIIIFLSAVDLQPELLTYYYRMMELAGIDDYRERLIFMTPELANRFPEHFSTAKLLYYSSRTLSQLKIITSDLPTILYPGQPCNQLLKICDVLDCYLFSGQPQRMKAFTTKSQTKRLLKNLCIDTLPSAMEMYDYGEFLNTFSVLIVKNTNTLNWVFKIDDEIQGRGIAYADFSGSKYLRSILRQLQARDPETFATEVTSDPEQQEATLKVREYLKQHLHERLQVAAPSVYRGFTDFMGRFIKKGGIIEAHPNFLREQLATASICFELTPDGEQKIITSYEKINGQPFRALACYFPQQAMDFNKAVSTIRQLCDSFKLRKIYGIFSMDFLVEKETGKQWVIGIDPFLNDYAASFHLFDMLMDGGYMSQKNIYLVDGQPQDSPDTEELSLEDRLVSRQYVFVPHLHHRNLSKVKVKQFFKHARLEQFNFDIGNREGTCVMLLDQLASGLLGLMTVYPSRSQALEQIKRMLDFITRISVVKNVEYGKSELHGSSDVTTLKDVLSTFTGVVRKGVRRNAKQRAVKQFENSRNLELI